MVHRVIPLLDQRNRATQALRSATPVDGPLLDQLHRPLHDLRISVTDRCNFRCSYCMPKAVFNKDYPYLPHSALLSFEEITRVARIAVAQGVRKIRLTGGEPLLRKNIEVLIAQLAALRTPDGQPLDLTLTTNGALLARKAQALKDAGLQRLTVSLDGLDDTIFRKMNDVDFPVRDVLDGLEAAHRAGLADIKVNMVVQRGTNDHEILPMARHFKGSGSTLRFIEYMDVGATNGWRMDQVVPSREVLQTLQTQWALHPLAPAAPGETAQRWAYADGSGEVGVISSVTQAFCADCSRARLSTDGKLYLCLFATQGHDLRSLLRSEATDDHLAAAIQGIWQGRSDRYSALRAALPFDTGTGAKRVEMSYIGG
nr:GTP 3',8-cyclase MoaA [uncultured Albidiferax sp.]